MSRRECKLKGMITMCRLHESEKASQRNHIIVDKIISSTKKITGCNVTIADISYIKYQLLKQDNSYELSSMNDADFNERLMAVIGG